MLSEMELLYFKLYFRMSVMGLLYFYLYFMLSEMGLLYFYLYFSISPLFYVFVILETRRISAIFCENFLCKIKLPILLEFLNACSCVLSVTHSHN